MARCAQASISFFLMWFFSAAAAASAQMVGGAIQGTVKDAQGAVLPGATVVVRNVATGASYEQTTDQTGHFQVPALPPGEYEVHVSLTGFRPLVASRHSPDGRPDGRHRHRARARADRRSDRGARRRGVGQPDLGRGQRPGRRARDSRSAAQRPIVSAARAAAARRAGRAGRRQRRGRRPHAEDFDQRRAARAEQLSARRHRHQQRLQQDAGLGGRRAARRRGGPRVSGAHQRLLGRVRPVGGRRLQRRDALGREPLHRVGLRVPSQLGARRAELLRSAVAAEAGLHAPSVRRRRWAARSQRDRTFFFGAYEGLVERLGVTGVTAVPDDDARRGILAGRPDHAASGDSALSRHCCFRAPTAARSATAAPSTSSPTRSRPTSTSISCASIIGRRRPTASSCASRTIAPRSMRIPPNKPPISMIDEQTRNTYVTGEHQHTFSSAHAQPAAASGSIARCRSPTTGAPSTFRRRPGVDSGRAVRLPDHPGAGHGDGRRLPAAAQRSPEQLADQRHADLDARPALCCGSAAQAQYLQFNQNTTSQVGGIVTFNNLELFLTGRPSNVDFAVPGKIDPDRQVPPVAVRRLRAGRRPADRPAVAEPRAALRGRDRADRGRRQDLEPAQRHRRRR